MHVNSFASCADALTNTANGTRWSNDSTSNICYNFCTALEKMLLIKILFFRWHKISPKGYRQVFTKIDKHHLSQLNNVIWNNLSGLDLERKYRSHVKGRDHMSKVTDVKVSTFSECFLFKDTKGSHTNIVYMSYNKIRLRYWLAYT